MKNRFLSFILLIILIIGVTGCGKKSNNSSENVTKVGKLDLEVEAIDSFSENLARIKIDGKYGYIDKLGNIVIEPQYSSAGKFSEGLASVCTGNGYNDKKCGYIDKNGKTVIDFKYADAEEFSFGYGVVKSGTKDIVIDKNANEILSFTHSYIYNFGPISKNLFIIPSKDANKGLAVVDKNETVIIDGIAGFGINNDGIINVHQVFDGVGDFWNDGKWGYIDDKGKLIIDYQYDYAGSFTDGLAAVVKDGKYGFINKENKYIIEPTFKYENAFDTPSFSDGLVVIYEKPTSTVYDTKGKKVFEKNFHIRAYKNGYAKFIKDDKYGFIDKKGNVVIDNKYQSVSDFNDGLALVFNNYDMDKDTGEFEFVNKDGKKILAGKINEHVDYTSSTKNKDSSSSKDTPNKNRDEENKSDNNAKENSSSSSNENNKNNNNSESNNNKSNNGNSNNNSSNSSGIPINGMTIKYGTYKGINAVEGDTLVINKDGTAVYNNDKKTTYYAGTYDFGQDSSSSDLTMAIIFDGTSFGWCGALYPTDNGNTLSCGSGFDYNYSGN